MTFDGNFMLGAATSAHQVEGNNVHSDYWVQENLDHSSFLEPSNIACDHYNRYEEDIKMLKSAGLNAYRFSIEWARIEPEKGEFDDNEINHYRQVIDCCKDMGVEPIVTLLHFTSPTWLIKEGGWESEKVIEYFARYTSYVIEKLGDRLAYVCTINEANMGLQLAAIAKRYEMMAKAAQKMKEPPAESGKEAEGKVQVGMNFQKMMENMKYQAAENMQAFGTPQPQTFVSARTPEGDIIVMKAHQAAKKEIKKLYPDIRVGITLSLHDLQAVEGGEKYVRDTWNEEFVHYLPYIKDDDFLGVQNYTRTVYGANGQLNPKEDAKLTQMLLRKNSIDSCTKLMIVAHPDDETLWGGGHMMSGDWFIVCLTNGDNKIRSKEYENVMKFTKNHGIILNYPDTLKGGGRSWWTKEDSDIRSDLNKLLNYKDWEVIVTHNPDGGTGHQHHILTCQKVTDICSVNGLLNKLYYHGIFYPKGTPIPADTPRLTPAEEAFKRKALAYYEHEKEAIKLFWAQMIPFEDWILSTDWEEVKAELAAAGIGLEDLYDEEVLDEEVLFEEELLEEEQTDEELADESLTVAEEPEDVPAAEVEAPAADEEPAAEVEPVVDEAPAAEEPSAEAEPVQDAVQEIPAE